MNEPELSPQEKARQNNQVALAILQMRRRAGLTQKQLALRIGTHQSVISDLESADYTGYSLEMLERIARALNMRLDLTFTPEDEGK